MIQVFHRDPPDFNLMMRTYPECYKKVAECDTRHLELAYVMTQNTGRSWVATEGVKVFAGLRHRSTSIGDVLVKEGKAYYVRPIGFSRVSEDG